MKTKTNFMLYQMILLQYKYTTIVIKCYLKEINLVHTLWFINTIWYIYK